VPVLEMALSGILISYTEDEETARKYLSEAALNKSENLLDFSLIRTERVILEPRRTTFLEVRLTGMSGGYQLPTDTLQQCEEEEGGVRCRIKSYHDEADPAAAMDTLELADRYLVSNHVIPAKSREIFAKAEKIAGAAGTPLLQIHLLVDWLYRNIDQVPEDVFSALDVLHSGRAECQGLAFLYAAFARSLGIPTRVVNGIVYAADAHQGFFYHTWTESFVEGRWLPVDPTYGQVVVDATHIKLVEGEGLDRLAPLTGLIGRLQVEILAVE
jgi:transglutaminase-like putative cysteine protease